MSMKKTLLLLVAIAGISYAKSFDLTFSQPAVLGPMEVESGHYKLSINGSMITLVNEDTHKSFETTATVQTSEKKYTDTVVRSKVDSGKMMVNEIELGGTKTALEFHR